MFIKHWRKSIESLLRISLPLSYSLLLSTLLALSESVPIYAKKIESVPIYLENKKLVVSYFKPTKTGVVTEDISSLDPGSDKKSVSEWGGLVEFTSKTNEIVAKLWR